MLTVLAKLMIRISSVEIVFILAVEKLSVINIQKLHAHRQVNIRSYGMFFRFLYSKMNSYLENITSKKAVKACFVCKGAENCKPEKLDGSEIRTSGAFGGKNLYCYTVWSWKRNLSFCLNNLFPHRNSIQKQAKLLLVVVLVLVKPLIRISNATQNIIYAAMKTCVINKQLVLVLNQMLKEIFTEDVCCVR